ncbi:MAG: ABC transporter substrate binding protein [Kosmotogaceae bacterium]
MWNKTIIAFIICFILVFTGVFATKIMIVHSYDEGYSWTEELTEGIQSVFKDKEIEWDVFYMETRLQTSEEWKIKAGRLALQRVEKFSPDVIIACDDNAQEYFAKEIMDIPVVFCGVNLEPSKYTYPRENIAGVRETLFTKEIIGMIKDLFPEISNIVFMGDRSETTAGIVEQLEEAEYEGIKKNILILDTFSKWKEAVKSIDGYNTAVVLLINRELKDENGEAVDSAEVTRWTANNSAVPVFAIMNYAVEEGAIGGVVNTGYGEGKQAGEIVKKFLSETSLEDVGVEKSENGYVMLNVASAMSAGVSFDSEWFEQVDEVVSNREMSSDTVLNLFVGSFEERVHGIMTSLKILSETPEVKSGEWAAMKPLLSAFNENYQGLAIYILPDGGYYSVQRNWTGLNLSNRGYFPVLKNGGDVKGYQVMSRSTGKRSVVFGVPVWNEERIIGFVGLSAFFENWNSELISEFKELDNLHFYAFDAQNTLALTDNTALLLGLLDVDVPGLSDRIDSLDNESGSFLFVANDTLNVAEYKKSSETGWTFVIANQYETEKKDRQMQALLNKVRNQLQETFNRLDKSLAEKTEILSLYYNNEGIVRSLLQELHKENPEVLDVSYISKNGYLKYIYPDDYSDIEGSWIGDRPYIKRLIETEKPVLSDTFFTVEDFFAVDLDWPVFNEDGEFMGALSFLIKPELFLAPIILPNNYNPYEFWIMHPDGTILYDQDTIEVGRNLFDDPLYEPFDSLLKLGEKISVNESGEGEYSFYSKGMDQLVRKEVKWTSVGLHGTQWRLILTKVSD